MVASTNHLLSCCFCLWNPHPGALGTQPLIQQSFRTAAWVQIPWYKSNPSTFWYCTLYRLRTASSLRKIYKVFEHPPRDFIRIPPGAFAQFITARQIYSDTSCRRKMVLNQFFCPSPGNTLLRTAEKFAKIEISRRGEGG